MKKAIILTGLIAASLGLKAQNTQPVAPKDTDVVIKIKLSKLVETQAVLKYYYDNILTSDAPSKTVQEVRKATEEVFPLLIADKPKEIKKGK